jgi:hypothetical protein
VRTEQVAQRFLNRSTLLSDKIIQNTSIIVTALTQISNNCFSFHYFSIKNDCMRFRWIDKHLLCECEHLTGLVVGKYEFLCDWSFGDAGQHRFEPINDQTNANFTFLHDKPHLGTNWATNVERNDVPKLYTEGRLFQRENGFFLETISSPINICKIGKKKKMRESCIKIFLPISCIYFFLRSWHIFIINFFTIA